MRERERQKEREGGRERIANKRRNKIRFAKNAAHAK